MSEPEEDRASPARVAALSMYDFPELREAHDLLWSGLVARLSDAGILGVPRHLTRDLPYRETWRHPGLLFGQACEYPMSKSFRECLQLVARPRYAAPGCNEDSYRSAILVRADDPSEGLDSLRNRRCVINEPDSNSGMNLLRAALAPIAGGTRFFESVCLSGSHLRSVELLTAHEADVTAIDCVTFAHLRKLHPLLTSNVRVIAWTPASPCLPYVTSRLTKETTLQALRWAITEVFADPSLTHSRELLLLEGVNVNPDATFGRVSELELDAQRWRYPTLQ